MTRMKVVFLVYSISFTIGQASENNFLDRLPRYTTPCYLPIPTQLQQKNPVIEKEHQKITYYLENYLPLQIRRAQGKQAIENPQYVQDKLEKVYFDLCRFIWNAFDRNPGWINNQEAVVVFEYMNPFAKKIKKQVIENKKWCQHAVMSIHTYEQIHGKRYFENPKDLNGWIGRIHTMHFYLIKLTELEKADRE